MKKNYIVWKRTFLVSMCELFCPVLLMSVLAISRTLISTNTYPAQSNINDVVFISPIVNYSQTVFPKETPAYVKSIFNQSVATGDEVTATLIGMGL
jgi:hypothetical protein